jgi:hypothetical protein
MTNTPEPSISPFALLRSSPDDAPNITRLRFAVMAMAGLLVLGFITVIGRIMYLVTRPSIQADISAPGGSFAQLPATAGSWTPQIQLMLPAGAHVKSQALSGQWLSVHFDGPSGEGLVIVDLATGRELARVRLATSP